MTALVQHVETPTKSFAAVSPKNTIANWATSSAASRRPLTRGTAMSAVFNGFAPVSDDDLVRLSRDNPRYRFERDDNGALIMRPTHSEGGAKRAQALLQLGAYMRRVGGKVYDSSTGFRMPQGGVRSPDASWISSPHLAALTSEERTGFWNVVPDVVIEVESDSDEPGEAERKIDMFFAHGARYGVAISPYTRKVYQRGTPPDGLRLDFDAIIDA